MLDLDMTVDSLAHAHCLRNEQCANDLKQDGHRKGEQNKFDQVLDQTTNKLLVKS